MSKLLLPHGATIGKAKVIVDIIGKGNPEIRPGTIIVPRFVTYHNTGNNGRGADADAHNRLIHNMSRKHPRDTSHVSWHLTVDENFIYQHIPFNEAAYHCGDGFGTKSGNRTSIGIEICEHVDQKNYAQAEENAIALGLYIAKLWNIPITNHVPHQKWSGKYCPRVILKRDGGFTKFHNRIKAANQGGLTVSQYEELKAEIREIKQLLNQKVNVSSPNEVGKTYEEAWNFLKSRGVTDGSNPGGPLIRQQFGLMAYRIINEFILNEGEASTWFKERLPIAVEKGITDGSNPKRLATREQVMAMNLKVYEELEKKLNSLEKKLKDLNKETN